MTTTTEICIDCDGHGFIPAAFKPISIPCRMCGGTGDMLSIQRQWREAGERHRQKRLNNFENLRDCAKRLNLDVIVLSDAERGVIDPSGVLPTE